MKCAIRPVRTDDGVTWNVWLGIMSEMVFDVERCNVKCSGNDVMRCEMQWPQVYTFHISPPQIDNISHPTVTFPA